METTHALAAKTWRPIVLVAALGGVGLAAALTAWGTFGESSYEMSDYLIVLGIIGVAAAIVFGWVVPSALRNKSAGLVGLVLSVLGLATVAVFWTGLPPVLAAGGVVLGIAGWNAASGVWAARAAVVIAAFAIVGDIALTVADMT